MMYNRGTRVGSTLISTEAGYEADGMQSVYPRGLFPVHHLQAMVLDRHGDAPADRSVQ